MKVATEASGQGGSNSTSVHKLQRLRSTRLNVQEALGEHVRAHVSHPATGAVEATVLDLSIHGAGLAVYRSDEAVSTFLLGDQLALTITCDDRVAYSGPAVVARAIDNGSVIVLGVELSQSGIDLNQIQRTSIRHSAAHRWDAARQSSTHANVAPEFRTWVLEAATQLEGAQAFLDHEEAQMASFDLATKKEQSEEVLNAVSPDITARMNLAGQELSTLVSELPKEAHTEYRCLLQQYLGKFFARSPFLHRAKSKPLGYAGDYEMMNMLYRDHREGATLFGKALNVYATQLPVARANINRIAYIGSKIRAAIAAKPTGRVHVASIGCGPAQEIFSYLTKNPEHGERLDIALIDQEERAIAHCQRTLAPLAARTNAKVRTINGSARRLLTDQKLGEALGRCDLVYSAGLFDYLADRTFIALLNVLFSALAPEGKLLVGNVAAHNPDRWAMEYFTEWFLHHRSAADLLSYAGQLPHAPRSTHVEAEPTGVNLFLVMDR